LIVIGVLLYAQRYSPRSQDVQRIHIDPPNSE